MAADEAETDTRIRIMHGGPFYDLMIRLGLRRRAGRVGVFALLSWLFPILLLLGSYGVEGARGFLSDWGAWAKFLIAPVLFTLTEKPIGFALDKCTTLLFRIPLISPQSMSDALRAVASAGERTTAWGAEAICLLIAIAASALNADNLFRGTAPVWAAADGNLTLAGLWCVGFSNTLYWFLLTRLIWKHFVWAGFLMEISRCHLRLAVSHPDGRGGLGFLGLYPGGYGLFSFAISSVLAAGLAHVMERQPVSSTIFAVACGAWLVIVVIFFALPLVGLATKIARLKQRTIMLSLARTTDYERWRERLALGQNIDANETEEDRDLQDVKPIYEAAMKTSALLINKSNILTVLLPALIPLFIAGGSFLSFSQLGPIAKRLLFL